MSIRLPVHLSQLDHSVSLFSKSRKNVLLGETCVCLSIIIPAFNEADTLAKTVADLRALFSQTLDYEIIIVNDGSSDATLDEASAIAAAVGNCRLISYVTNQGKGYALRQGFAEARGQLVAFIDADGEINPKELFALLHYQRTAGVSVVVGKRVVLGSRPGYRQIMTRTVRFVGSAVFKLPVSDSQTGVKLFVKSDVEDLIPKCKESGYLFDLELLALAHYRGLQIHEIPVEVTILRTSRINLLTGFKSLSRMAKLVLSRSRLVSHASPLHTSGSQPAPLATSLLSIVLRKEPLGK